MDVRRLHRRRIVEHVNRHSDLRSQALHNTSQKNLQKRQAVGTPLYRLRPRGASSILGRIATRTDHVLPGPWPVARETSDRSDLGIHQLLSNGEEWVDQQGGVDRLNLADDKPGGKYASYVGAAPRDMQVPGFDKSPQSALWGTVTADVSVGFRIALEPK